MGYTELYEKLARHLDQGFIGAPTSPTLLEIIKILFPVEEAEIAVELPMQNSTLSELKTLFPHKQDSLEKILSSMVKRGTVYTSQKPGQERKYRLLPSVVGWAETPFWGGKQSEVTRKLGPMWLKYRNEAFGAELARNNMPVMRVIPATGTIHDNRQVLPFDELKPKIEAASYRAVGHCPCRQMKRTAGEGCDHLLENCIHFGSMGRYMVENDLAREITVEETFEILKKSNEDGLVHIIDNVEGHMSTICNCCGCCCVFLDTQKKMGIHTLSSSNYVSVVDTEVCAGCATCQERCPMQAIAVGDDDIARVNETLCIGCGVCKPTCSTGAIALEQREKVEPPPDLETFFMTRYKAEVTD